MEQEDTLESILNLQLSSETLTVLYLPSILSLLSPEHFSTEPNGAKQGVSLSHINKWMNRIMSLMQSKDAGARWAGICLARKTGHIRRDLLVEYAQRWINLTLPLLSKTEPPPVWKASIDLLVYIFMNTSHLADFRRQVSTPTVPKLTTALLDLFPKPDPSLKILIISSLSKLVTRFPTLHRALGPNILGIVYPVLSGASTSSHSSELIRSTAYLLASMHHLDGKPGAPLAWRNTLDATIAEVWKCISHLQGQVYMSPISPKKPFGLPSLPSDPLMSYQVALDRLHNLIVIFEALFSANPTRSVLVPVSDLAQLTLHLLRGDLPPSSSQVDFTLLQLQRQVAPKLVEEGECLAATLASSLRQNLTPHATSLVSSFVYHLEREKSSRRINHLLHSLQAVLDHTTTHSTLLPARLFRAIVPKLSALLPRKRAIETTTSRGATSNGLRDQLGSSRKNKKRQRDFEGADVLGVSSADNLLDDPEQAQTVLLALDILQRVLRMQHLSASLHSLGSRLVLGLQLHVISDPNLANPSLSTSSGGDSFRNQLQSKLLDIQGELSLGTAGHAWRGLTLMTDVLRHCDMDSAVSEAAISGFSTIDTLIHPRLPPPLRSLPRAESIMLFRAEEPKEEREQRIGLRLIDGLDLDVEVMERRDVEMEPVAPIQNRILEHASSSTKVVPTPAP
ncbi:hypothetical protein FRC20_001944, partial [Serendipita sp. 405]